jgi:hypothetical protein
VRPISRRGSATASSDTVRTSRCSKWSSQPASPRKKSRRWRRANLIRFFSSARDRLQASPALAGCGTASSGSARSYSPPHSGSFARRAGAGLADDFARGSAGVVGHLRAVLRCFVARDAGATRNEIPVVQHGAVGLEAVAGKSREKPGRVAACRRQYRQEQESAPATPGEPDDGFSQAPRATPELIAHT